MRKIISFVLLIITVIVLWQAISIYSLANEPIRQKEEKALDFVKKTIAIDRIVKRDFYHGTDSYQVFEALDSNGEEIIIWVPDTLNKYVMKKKDQGISFTVVRQFVIEKLHPKQIISIKLGMENSIPLYEIIYKDQQNRYAYYFITFNDGTYLKHYYLKQL